MGYENQGKFAKVFCESPWHSSVEIPQTFEVSQKYLWNHGDFAYAVGGLRHVNAVKAQRDSEIFFRFFVVCCYGNGQRRRLSYTIVLS